MPYFTKEQEEQAVRLILKECNSCGHGDISLNSVSCCSYVERDKEGHVIGLVDLGLQRLSKANVSIKNKEISTIQTSSTPTSRHWRMPPAIGYLTRLRKLTVYHCKHLPLEIIHLADSLQEIAFHFCDELDFDTLPKEFECLHRLTDFRIHGMTATGSIESQRILPIHRLKNFSNLRYLYYRSGPTMDSNGSEKEEINFMLNHAVGISSSPDANSRLVQDLLCNDVRFKNSLEILEVEGGNLTEFTVANMFSHVLPQYPNLRHLVLPNNKIRSLSPIIAQLPAAVSPNVRLRCFHLLGNPVLDVASRNDELLLLQPEQTNLLRLLSLYEEITSLGHGITESNVCSTELLLALDLNDGGKVLLSERFRPIPLSVWPTVLERANQRKGYYESSNVLYHLLRNGPAMGKRRHNRPARCFSNGSTTTNDENVWLSRVESVTGISPMAQFLTTGPSVAPATMASTMTTTRKRKISMP